ncbi:MAG: MBL fold metallo-hydrolase [Candidatus Heimdallarchaeota archaeon]|nr:MBL fold metallo-hydrolase [Candidatus Heimdallarchaeota archaeon]MCK4254947.1 MBL fold metallo-hydrolase [Candidatus Heimdallarchaeota archaeon]
MKIFIKNVYNNTALDGKHLKAGYGQSLYIESEEHKILYDVGFKGKDFVHNMRKLNINPNDIDFLILSHGHFDHTFGLEAFLKERGSEKKVNIIAHPDAIEEKKVLFPLSLLFALKFKTTKLGFPPLSKEQKEMIDFNFVKEPFEITPFLDTLGEIRERPEKDGTMKLLTHKEENKWVKDPIHDDLSLVLKTKEGLVLICGCCHAGLLNTCEAVVQKYENQKIVSIIGGTHMMRFSEEEVDYVADRLEKVYGTPKLYLGHCTGNKTIGLLKHHFGEEVVKPFHVGTQLTFEC